MSEFVRVQLDGVTDIRAAFKELRDYLPKKALRTALRQGAEYMDGFIVLMAPRMAGGTGRLKRNITVKARDTDGTTRARIVVSTKGGRNDDRNSFYWRFLEEGFHTRRGDFKRFPFIASVFNAKNKIAAQFAIDAMDQALIRAEGKARRVARRSIRKWG